MQPNRTLLGVEGSAWQVATEEKLKQTNKQNKRREELKKQKNKKEKNNLNKKQWPFAINGQMVENPQC